MNIGNKRKQIIEKKKNMTCDSYYNETPYQSEYQFEYSQINNIKQSNKKKFFYSSLSEKNIKNCYKISNANFQKKNQRSTSESKKKSKFLFKRHNENIFENIHKLGSNKNSNIPQMHQFENNTNKKILNEYYQDEQKRNPNEKSQTKKNIVKKKKKQIQIEKSSEKKFTNDELTLYEVFGEICEDSHIKLDKNILDMARYIQESKNLSFKSLESFKKKFRDIINKNCSCTKKQILELIYHFVFFKKGFNLRNPQLISLIICTEPNYNLNILKKLLQVNTGEGKTLINQCLALYFVLHELKVDIVTSSDVLVKDNANDAIKFFENTGISVAYIDSNVQTYGSLEEQRKCYSADILYGTCHQFCVGILDEFEKLEIVRFDQENKKRREFEIVLIDEVDSMLIDSFSNMTIISNNLGKNHDIELAKEIIWINILKDCDKKLKYPNSISNLEMDIKKKIYSKLKLNVDDRKYYDEKFSHKIIREMWKIWIESAKTALFNYNRDQEYILTEDESGKRVIKLMNIDTGMIQEGMRLQDGVHEFIERKEGLRMDQESNACFFKSCVNFFQKYLHIIGLTGTLGSENYRRFFYEIYGTESYIIPPFKRSLFSDEKMLVYSNEQEWIEGIFIDLQEKYIKNRSVLVIFRTIRELNLFKQKLDTKKYKYFEYMNSNDDTNSEKLENIELGTIILATNLGGRGTDFKLNKNLIKNKGMHIILTFFTVNSRVSSQAFGRVARKGEPGTGRFIINGEKNPQVLKQISNDKSKSNRPAFNTYNRTKIKNKVKPLDDYKLKEKVELDEIKLYTEQRKLEHIKLQILFNYNIREKLHEKLTNWLLINKEEVKASGLFGAVKNLFVTSFKNLEKKISQFFKKSNKIDCEKEKNYLSDLYNFSDTEFSNFLKDYQKLKNNPVLYMENPNVILNFVQEKIFYDKNFKNDTTKRLNLKILKSDPTNINAQIFDHILNNSPNKKNLIDNILRSISSKINFVEKIYNDNIFNCKLYQKILNKYKLIKNDDSLLKIKQKEVDKKKNKLSQDLLKTNKKLNSFLMNKGDFTYEFIDEYIYLLQIQKMFKSCEFKEFDFIINPISSSNKFLEICNLFFIPEIKRKNINFSKIYEEAEGFSMKLIMNKLKISKNDEINKINTIYGSNNSHSVNTKKDKILFDRKEKLVFEIESESKNITQKIKKIWSELFFGLLFSFYLRKEEFFSDFASVESLNSEIFKFEKTFDEYIIQKCLKTRHCFAEIFLANYFLDRKIKEKDIKRAANNVLKYFKKCKLIIGLPSRENFDVVQIFIMDFLENQEKLIIPKFEFLFDTLKKVLDDYGKQVLLKMISEKIYREIPKMFKFVLNLKKETILMLYLFNRDQVKNELFIFFKKYSSPSQHNIDACKAIIIKLNEIFDKIDSFGKIFCFFVNWYLRFDRTFDLNDILKNEIIYEMTN